MRFLTIKLKRNYYCLVQNVASPFFGKHMFQRHKMGNVNNQVGSLGIQTMNQDIVKSNSNHNSLTLLKQFLLNLKIVILIELLLLHN